MVAGYEMGVPPPGHPAEVVGARAARTAVGLGRPMLVTAVVALGVVTRAPVVVAAGAAIALLVGGRRGRWGCVLVIVVLGTTATVRSGAARASLAPDELGPFHGWTTVVGEPRRAGAATRVVLQIEGERFEVWVRGPARQLRTRTWRGGDRVEVAGEREALDESRAARVASQHVVGELVPEWLGDARAGSRLGETSNRVREAIARGAAALPDDQAALTRGLVIGDDRDQPDEMVERFRASGLAHLTAVSGQNVAFVLAAAGPLLRRAPPWWRWAASLALIGWFVLLTRAEPSVLRAGAMAALGVTAVAMGRPREPARLLLVAVTGLLLLDPLLAWSVGFWLSVGATGGVTVIGPWLTPRLGRLGPLAPAVATTLGAQAGVAAPSVLVFGSLSLVGVVANVVAVPVAGLVMLLGLPACLVAGFVPAIAPVVMAPVGWCVRWVDAVATVGAGVEPRPPWSWLGWALVVAAVVALARASPRDAQSSATTSISPRMPCS